MHMQSSLRNLLTVKVNKNIKRRERQGLDMKRYAAISKADDSSYVLIDIDELKSVKKTANEIISMIQSGCDVDGLYVNVFIDGVRLCCEDYLPRIGDSDTEFEVIITEYPSSDNIGMIVTDSYGNMLCVTPDFMFNGMVTNNSYRYAGRHEPDIDTDGIIQRRIVNKSADSTGIAKRAMLGTDWFRVDRFGHMVFSENRECSLVVPSTCTEIMPEQLRRSKAESIVIKDGCRQIWRNAARDTEAEYVEIAGTVEDIWDGAFEHAENLKKVVLHEGIKRIHPFAFAHTDKLMEVVLPDSLEWYDACAFDNGVKIVNGDGKSRRIE